MTKTSFRSILPFLVLIGVLTIAGCTGSVQVVQPAYRSVHLIADTLSVAPFSVFISNKDDVDDDLGHGESQIVYRSFFDSAFAYYTTKSPTIRSVRTGSVVTSGALLPVTLRLGENRSVYLHLPREGSSIGIDSVTPSYILFFDNFAVKRNAGTAGMMMPGARGAMYYSGGTSANLSHDVDYALWDNRTGQVISYGAVNTSSDIGLLGMNRTHWKDCVHDLARSIINKGPFRPDRWNDSLTGGMERNRISPRWEFKVRAGYEYVAHLRDKDAEDPNVPSFAQSNAERPSVAYFFNDGNGYFAEGQVSMSLSDETTTRIVLGMEGEQNTSSNHYHQGSDIALGGTLTATTLHPFLGAEFPMSLPVLTAYGRIGLLFRTFTGSFDQNGTHFETKYSAPDAVRFSVGMECDHIVLPEIFLAGGLNLDIGTVTASSVTVSQNGTSTIVPITGETTLRSDAFQIHFALGYRF